MFLRGWYCRTHTYYSKPSRRVGNFPWIQENRAFTFPQKKRNFHPPLLGEPNQLRFVSRTRPQGCFLFIGKYATILSHYRRFYSPLPVGLFSAPILRTWPASASLCSYLSVPLLYHVASVLFLLYTFSYSFYFGCKGEIQRNFESILFLNGTFLFYLFIFLFYFYISFQVYPIELYPPPLFFRRGRFGREKNKGEIRSQSQRQIERTPLRTEGQKQRPQVVRNTQMAWVSQQWAAVGPQLAVFLHQPQSPTWDECYPCCSRDNTFRKPWLWYTARPSLPRRPSTVSTYLGNILF